VPEDFEFHGNQVWGGSHHWEGKTPTEQITAYLEVMDLLNTCLIDVAYASINKAGLHDKYDGAHDDNAYRLALQFLLEKVDRNLGDALKVLVADEARAEGVHAVKMGV